MIIELTEGDPVNLGVILTHTHSYEDTVTAPTCMAQGYTTHTCICGDEYVDAYVEVASHNFVNYVSNNDATCTADGTETAACSYSGCTATDTRTVKNSKLSHTPNDSGYCTQCDSPVQGTVGVSYTVSDDETYAIVSGYNGSFSRVLIADSYDGLPVTTVAASAFRDSRITSVTIPSSITTIENYAFNNCKKLETVTFAGLAEGATSLLTKIGNYVFQYCTSLTSFTLPDSVTTIGEYAFGACKNLTTLTLPDSVALIGKYAFTNTAITAMTIPTTVKSIGDCAFRNCKELKSVTLGSSTLTTVGNNLFDDCSALTSVTLRDGLTKLGGLGASKEEAAPALTTISIPSSVTTMLANAFRYSKIPSVDLSNTSIAELPSSAFYGSMVTAVKLPATCTKFSDSNTFCKSKIKSIDLSKVTYFGVSSFENCRNLASVT